MKPRGSRKLEEESEKQRGPRRAALESMKVAGKRTAASEDGKDEHGNQKRHKSGKRNMEGVGFPVRKRKRVSFATELEKTKVFDEKRNLRVMPSGAGPGKSIILKKDSQKESFVHSVPISSKEGISIKSDVLVDSTAEQSRGESIKKKFERESPTGRETKLVLEKSRETGSKDKRINEYMGESGVKKFRFTRGRKKLKVTRRVKEKLLTMPRKERKIYIRELQRKRKPNFDLALRCKILWEKLRSGKTKETERKKCVSEIHGMLKGKVKELIFAHDTCRVVECLVASGGTDVRTALFDELIPEIVHLTKSKYARFFVTKMLKHGSAAQRQVIFDAFRGHCVSLMRITSAAQVLETAYNDYANAQQRFNIIIEFYGVDFSVFKDADNKVRPLKDLIANDPSRKMSIIRHLEQILTDVVDKPQVKLSLTHRLLSDFFEFADNKQMEEMIDSLKLHIPEMVHTSDGVRTAMKCLWNSSAKERKVMLKNLKGLVTKMCAEEYAHRFLIAIFDTVDDTVLVSKCVLKEVVDNVGQIVKSHHGLKVLHHLIHPRDPRFCSGSQIAVYKEGDGNPHSKKDAKLRYAELFAYVRKPFCKYFAANMEALLYEQQASLLILDIFEAPILDLFERIVDVEDRASCYDAISSACSREFVPCDAEKLHPVEHPQAHFVISKLLKSDSKLDVKLSDFIMKHCGEQIASWLSCNKGCFILLHMLENSSVATRECIKQTLLLSTVERYHTKGAELLLQKLNS